MSWLRLVGILFYDLTDIFTSQLWICHCILRDYVCCTTVNERFYMKIYWIQRSIKLIGHKTCVLNTSKHYSTICLLSNCLIYISPLANGCFLGNEGTSRGQEKAGGTLYLETFIPGRRL